MGAAGLGVSGGERPRVVSESGRAAGGRREEAGGAQGRLRWGPLGRGERG